MNGEQSSAAHNQYLQDRLNNAREFIKSSFHQEISLNGIAGVACLEKHYFLREFKKQFNITPWRYLQDIRLQEASKLLSTTNKKIYDVCTAVGFKDSGSFSRLFKSRYGLPPKSIKKLTGS